VGAVRRQYREGLYRISFEQAPEPAQWASTSFERVGGQVIEAFQEVLPSLNDIFIRLVEGTTAARAFQQAH